MLTPGAALPQPERHYGADRGPPLGSEGTGVLGSGWRQEPSDSQNPCHAPGIPEHQTPLRSEAGAKDCLGMSNSAHPLTDYVRNHPITLVLSIGASILTIAAFASDRLSRDARYPDATIVLQSTSTGAEAPATVVASTTEAVASPTVSAPMTEGEVPTTVAAPTTHVSLASSQTTASAADGGSESPSTIDSVQISQIQLEDWFGRPETEAIPVLQSQGLMVHAYPVCSGSVGAGEVRQVLGPSGEILVDKSGVTALGMEVNPGSDIEVKVGTGRPC